MKLVVHFRPPKIILQKETADLYYNVYNYYFVSSKYKIKSMLCISPCLLSTEVHLCSKENDVYCVTCIKNTLITFCVSIYMCDRNNSKKVLGLNAELFWDLYILHCPCTNRFRRVVLIIEILVSEVSVETVINGGECRDSD